MFTNFLVLICVMLRFMLVAIIALEFSVMMRDRTMMRFVTRWCASSLVTYHLLKTGTRMRMWRNAKYSDLVSRELTAAESIMKASLSDAKQEEILMHNVGFLTAIAAYGVTYFVVTILEVVVIGGEFGYVALGSRVFVLIAHMVLVSFMARRLKPIYEVFIAEIDAAIARADTAMNFWKEVAKN